MIANKVHQASKDANRLMIRMAVLSAIAFCLAIYWRLFGGIRMLAHDTIGFNYPWREFLSDALRSGVFPWWDPFNSPGSPIAFPSSPNYFPLALLVSFFRTYDVYSFLFEILITHLLSLAGMYLWLRVNGANIILAIVGAIGFSGCGPLVTSLQSYPVQVTMMFVPWFFLGIHLLVCSSRNKPRTRILGIIHITWSSVLILTGGYLVIFVPMILFGTLYAFWEIWRSPYKMLTAAIGVLISLAVTFLILLLPLSEYIRLVYPDMAILRGIDAGFDPYNGALPPASLLTLFLPSGVYLPLITVGRAEQMYIGLLLGLSFLLPLAGIPFKRRDLKNILIAVMVTLVAMGSWNPIARLFVEYVPGIRWLRFHVFWGIIVEFLLITTAVTMLGRLLRMMKFSEGKKVIRRVLGLMWLVVLLVFGVSAYFSHLTNRKLILTTYDYFEYTWVVLTGIVASLIWFLLTRKRLDKKPLIILNAKFMTCILFVIFLMILLSYFLPGGITQSLLSIFDGPIKIQPISGGFSSFAHALDETTHTIVGWTMLKMDGLHVVWVLLAGTFILWNYRKGTVWMSISILIIVFLDLGVASQRYTHGNPYWIGNSLSGNERRICFSGNKREQGNENIAPFFSRGPYLNTYSRFYNPKIVEMANQPETGPFLLKLAYFFPTDGAEKFEDWRQRGNNNVIKSVELCPNKVTVVLDTETPGWVVSTDSWAPGWKAVINGFPKTVKVFWGLFKGVDVPSGRSNVVFFYKPVYLIHGLISLILGVSILAGLAFWARKKGQMKKQ
jgi:hypothetical protein